MNEYFVLMAGAWIFFVGAIVGHNHGRQKKKDKEAFAWEILETLSKGSNKESCRLIGMALEIDIDPGEDLGEYVQFACREAWVERQRQELRYQESILDRKLREGRP